jgi:hypothetical protein
VVEINDHISMHAQKTVWVKRCLEVLQALAKQMGRCSHVKPNVLPRRLHPLDIVDSHKHNLLACFHGQPLQILAAGWLGILFARPIGGLQLHPSTNDFRSSQIQRSLKALEIKWLNQ